MIRVKQRLLVFQVSQGHFDLLAELMKFNEAAFKAFEEAVINGDRFDNFMKLAADRYRDLITYSSF